MLIDLLSNMLKFNPSQRLTAAECLTNSLFDEVRDLTKETGVAFKDIECNEGFKDKKEAKEYLIKLM